MIPALPTGDNVPARTDDPAAVAEIVCPGSKSRDPMGQNRAASTRPGQTKSNPTKVRVVVKRGTPRQNNTHTTKNLVAIPKIWGRISATREVGALWWNPSSNQRSRPERQWSPMDETPIQILMVEDNDADARLTMESLKEGKVANSVNLVQDGVEAIEYLRQQGKYADAYRPDLILLDLNLPRKDGREVLAEIKSDPELRSIPVVILTCSTAETDIAKSYADQANCYIVKPVTLDGLMEVVKAIEQFWVTVIRLPAADAVNVT